MSLKKKLAFVRSSKPKHHRSASVVISVTSGLALSSLLLGVSPASAAPKADARLAAGVSRARAVIATYSKIPKTPYIGPAFNAKVDKGRLIYVIQTTSSAFNKAISDAEKSAGALVGAKVVIFPTTGQVTQYENGVEAAIAAHANVIDLQAVNPSYIVPQLREARAKGIKVTSTLFTDSADPFPTGISGGVKDDNTLIGTLEADYAIVKTGGKLNAIYDLSEDVAQTGDILAGFRAALKENCPGCTVTTVNEPVPSWPSFNGATAAALARDPKANYVVAEFDSFATFAVAGIASAEADGRVHLDTYAGSTSVLSLIKRNSVVQMDIGSSSESIGLAAMNDDLRLAAGKPGVAGTIGQRVFDLQNISQVGKPPSIAKGYGSNLEAPFLKAWGLS